MSKGWQAGGFQIHVNCADVHHQSPPIHHWQHQEPGLRWHVVRETSPRQASSPLTSLMHHSGPCRSSHNLTWVMCVCVVHIHYEQIFKIVQFFHEMCSKGSLWKVIRLFEYDGHETGLWNPESSCRNMTLSDVWWLIRRKILFWAKPPSNGNKSSSPSKGGRDEESFSSGYVASLLSLVDDRGGRLISVVPPFPRETTQQHQASDWQE